MIDLIEKLAQSIDSADDSKKLTGALRDFFIKNFKVNRFDVFVIDKKNNTVKDISKDWINPNSDNITEINKNTVNNLKTTKYLTDYKNSLEYALTNNGDLIGFIRINGGNSDRLIEFLQTASFIISIKIQNILLAESMQKNIDFYELMRNIAKIIETQYELNYVVPLIGEMIDKFMPDYLIYIFIKNNSKMELIWPSNCKDPTILAEIKKLQDKYDYNIIKSQSTILFPLVNENTLLGCIAAKSMGTEFNETDINYLEQLAKQSSSTY